MSAGAPTQPNSRAALATLFKRQQRAAHMVSFSAAGEAAGGDAGKRQRRLSLQVRLRVHSRQQAATGSMGGVVFSSSWQEAAPSQL
jgi:hypothetical protein